MPATQLKCHVTKCDPFALARELGALLEKRGVPFIDAPVSNGVRSAIAGTLSIMVGGDKLLFERCKPLFEKMGNQIFHAGPLGAGHAIKALNTMFPRRASLPPAKR